MARIRTIKPDFFTSLSVADLTPLARLTFIGLWTHVDDEGRCVDDARLVKAAVSPLERTVSAIEADLKSLVKQGLVIRYEVGGRHYIQVTNWSEHQKINRPTKSKFPAPHAMWPQAVLTEDSLRTHDRKGKERNRERKGALVTSSSQSSPHQANGDGLDLDRIKKVTRGNDTHARKTADFVLAKAPADVRNPTAYVLAAIDDDPDAYRYRRGNPTKDTECPQHAGEWGDACRQCALAQRIGDLA